MFLMGESSAWFFWTWAQWLWAWCPVQALLWQQKSPDWRGGIGVFCKVVLLCCSATPFPKGRGDPSSRGVVWSTWLLRVVSVLCCQDFSESGPNCQVCSHSHKTLLVLNELWIKVLVALRGGGGGKNELNALEVWSNDTIVSCWFLFTLSSSSEYKVQL